MFIKPKGKDDEGARWISPYPAKGTKIHGRGVKKKIKKKKK